MQPRGSAPSASTTTRPASSSTSLAPWRRWATPTLPPRRGRGPCPSSNPSAVSTPSRQMRPPPDRVERLPQQYFTALLAEVSRHAAMEGEPLVDLGRGNPEVGPPQHVIDELAARANEHA